MKFDNPNTKIAIVSIAGIAIVLIIIVLLNGHGSNNGSQNPSTYTDPYSHQTVSNDTGKGPDTYGTQKGTPVYLGFDAFLDKGLTLDQVKDLQAAFLNYSQKTGGIKEVSIHVDGIKQSGYDPNNPSPVSYVTFDVTLDRKTTLHAKAQYEDISSIQLFLYNGSQQVFDSGVISPGSG